MTEISTISTPFQYVFKGLAGAIGKKKKLKGYIRKDRVKLSLFADNILYLIDLQNSIRKLLEIINNFNRVAGYYIQKSTAFLTTNKHTEKEIMDILSFI